MNAGPTASLSAGGEDTLDASHISSALPFPLSQRERAGVRENHSNENSPSVQDEGEQTTNSKLNPQNSTFPLDPDNKRNGKIT